MTTSPLYNLITYLQYGTKLHIGVLFIGNHGSPLCTLPTKHQIHSGPLCEEFKKKGHAGFRRCFACRNLAIRKALADKVPFGGLCINGIYEYTHPVLINEEVACIIYIGNILEEATGRAKLLKNIETGSALFSTLEGNFGYEKCWEVAQLLESYIRMLLVKYPRSDSDTNPLVENIKSYIHSNLEFDVEVSRIAEFFHYNPLYLGRLFKKETGQSINEYINLQRIERAKELLYDGHATVLEIANRVGYNNVTYFNRMFKRITKLTPTQYQKQLHT